MRSPTQTEVLEKALADKIDNDQTYDSFREMMKRIRQFGSDGPAKPMPKIAQWEGLPRCKKRMTFQR